MTADSQWATQQAIYQRLTNWAPLIALLRNGAASIFDAVPQNEPEPYLSFGDQTGEPWDTKDSDGMSHLVQVSAWSIQPGFREVKLIMAEVVNALDHQPLIIAGHDHVRTEMEFSTTFRDPDGITRQQVMRFRVWTEKS